MDAFRRLCETAEQAHAQLPRNLDEMAPAGIECSCDICGQGVSEVHEMCAGTFKQHSDFLLTFKLPYFPG